MSRESDIAILKDIKFRIEESSTYLERCHAINAQREALEKEKLKTTPPPVTLKSTNSYDKLKSQYDDKWRKSHLDCKKTRILLKILSTVLLLALGVVVVADLYANTGIYMSAEMAEKIKSTVDQNDLTGATVFHVILTIVSIIIPLKVE